MQDANKNRLYVHEVFVADGIKKGDTLQTAASQPHGGISLYRDILANVLENGQTSEQVQNSQSSICENSESVISDKEKAQKKAGNQQEGAGNAKNDAPDASLRKRQERRQCKAGERRRGFRKAAQHDGVHCRQVRLQDRVARDDGTEHAL